MIEWNLTAPSYAHENMTKSLFLSARQDRASYCGIWCFIYLKMCWTERWDSGRVLVLHLSDLTGFDPSIPFTPLAPPGIVPECSQEHFQVWSKNITNKLETNKQKNYEFPLWRSPSSLLNISLYLFLCFYFTSLKK